MILEKRIRIIFHLPLLLLSKDSSLLVKEKLLKALQELLPTFNKRKVSVRRSCFSSKGDKSVRSTKKEERRRSLISIWDKL